MRTRDEAKEKAIREHAMKLIVKEGFDGLSMHKLAKAAGISVATIYIYYKDREDLIMNLCNLEMERLAEATLKNFDPQMPFAEGLKVQWKNRAAFCLQNPIEAQFIERMRHSPYHDIVRNNMKKDFSDAMYAFLENAIKRKELVSIPVDVFWSLAYGPLYQMVKFHWDKHRFPGREPFELTDKVMNQALKLVIKALTP